MCVNLNNKVTINPATEIVEENNYYPFGLKHEGYNELPGAGYKYKFLNKEYEDSFGLNVTETDYRQYDAASGRFNVMDALSEMAPNYTPYRYGFNNPILFSDPSGLFETWDQAISFMLEHNISGTIRRSAFNDSFVIAGADDNSGRYWENFAETIYDPIVVGNGGGGGSGGGSSDSFGLGLGALGTISSATSEYAMYKVASGFKSNNNLWDFQKLSPKQQNWRINAELGPKGNAVLGKHGLKILKYSKAAGVVGTAVGVGYSGYKIYNGTATTIDYVDAGVGTASLVATVFLASNPVGWAIGAGAGLYFAGRFIYDVTQE